VATTYVDIASFVSVTSTGLTDDDDDDDDAGSVRVAGQTTNGWIGR
jgi:hypothetical protein